MLDGECNATLENFDLVKRWNDLKDLINRHPALRSITIEAWDRCQKLNVDPQDIKFEFLSQIALEEKIDANNYLIQAAKPYLDYLSLSLSGIPHVVALLDRDCWVIDIRGTTEELGGRSRGLCCGASWKEELIGNNGGGTSIELKKPVFIYGHEHFTNLYKPFSCLGVPIFKNNEVIGTIDVSVLNQYAHPGRLTIAMACVESIEKEIADSSSNHKNIEASKKLIATAELMATAVHDLKNPLANIRGLAQLGTLTASSKKEQSYFDRIIKQVDMLHSSVIDLQNVFKPETPAEINPSDIVREVLYELQPFSEIHKTLFSFSTSFENKIPLHPKLFRRAIENLIKNALQAINNEGKIEVDIGRNDGDLLISIRDNGPGIPHEIKDTLFQPFVHHRMDGSGLGLFMVNYCITEIHGGKLWFDSEPGKGTAFYIKLPVK